MYKIIGADGQEYGPVTADQLKGWLAQGRINALTRIQAAGGAEWKPAAEVPELAALFAPPGVQRVGEGAPPLLTVSPTQVREKGLAILSFVLGLASFVLCLSAITGIPAIICGHLSRRRVARLPARYGGAGFAMAGMVLGYLSLVFSLVIVGLLLPALGKATRTVQGTSCQNNLKQIGLALKVWALEHNDQYPFNVSTNSGGSLELCAPGPDGFDRNAIAHFLVVRNELSTPQFLVCPNDPSKHPALDFASLQQASVSYQLRTGTNINDENPQEVLAICPIHGNELFCDGNVRKAPRARQ
jgi:competence protein ComGC